MDEENTNSSDDKSRFLKCLSAVESFSQKNAFNTVLLAAVAQKFGSMSFAPTSDVISSKHPYTRAIHATIAALSTNKDLGLISGLIIQKYEKKDRAVDATVQAQQENNVSETNTTKLAKGLEKANEIAKSKELNGLLYSSIAQTFLSLTFSPDADSIESGHPYKKALNGSISVFAAIIAAGVLSGIALKCMNKSKTSDNIPQENDVESLESKSEKNDKKTGLEKFRAFALGSEVDFLLNASAAARFGAAGFAHDSDIASVDNNYMRILNGAIAVSAGLIALGLASKYINNGKNKNPSQNAGDDYDLDSTTNSMTLAQRFKSDRNKENIISASEDRAVELGM